MELIETKEYKMNYTDFNRRVVQRTPLALYKAGFILRGRKQIYNTAYAEWNEDPQGTFNARDLSHEYDGEEIELMARAGGEISLHYNRERKTVRVNGIINHSTADVKKRLRSDLENLLNIRIPPINNSLSLLQKQLQLGRK